MTRCHVCFRHCDLVEGGTGFCGARICRGGEVVAANYGRITSIALDPIEKKPLRRFYPGSRILSVGSYGCNLRCPFCQNNEISWGEEVKEYMASAGTLKPDELVELGIKYRNKGNIGIAYTYNEPLIGYEFVRDTARMAHDAGLKNVLVSNGTASLSVLSEIAPYIDAMNIDLKCFDPDIYRNVLGGDLEMTKAFIANAVKTSHVELTSLIVPGINDTHEMMRDMTSWIASLGKDIPLHITRFYPRFHMADRSPTPVSLINDLAETARERLDNVFW